MNYNVGSSVLTCNTAINASTVNGNTITVGSSTFTGSAGQTYTFPSTSASLARTDAGQSFSGTQVFGTLRAQTFQNNSNGHVVDASTGPVVTSGFGVSPTITQNGSFAFTVTVGASPGPGGVINMNTTASNGWICAATDYTTPSEQVRETTYSTTAPGFTFYTWAGTATAPTAGDVVGFACRAN